MRDPDMLVYADRQPREHMPTAAQSREAVNIEADRRHFMLTLAKMDAATVIELVLAHFLKHPPEAEKYADQFEQFGNEIGRMAWEMGREADETVA